MTYEFSLYVYNVNMFKFIFAYIHRSSTSVPITLYTLIDLDSIYVSLSYLFCIDVCLYCMCTHTCQLHLCQLLLTPQRLCTKFIYIIRKPKELLTPVLSKVSQQACRIKGGALDGHSLKSSFLPHCVSRYTTSSLTRSLTLIQSRTTGVLN